jgi:hypothetical protein
VKTMLMVIGEPGVGKSTAVAAALAPYTAHLCTVEGVAHMHYRDEDYRFRLAQLGKEREDFSGTDALPMNVIDAAEEYLRFPCVDRLLVEGARLANRRFIDTAIWEGWTVKVLLLEGEGVAAQRRLQRGTQQDPAFVKGRRTAAANLAKSVMADVQVVKRRLSGNETPEQVGGSITSLLGL